MTPTLSRGITHANVLMTLLIVCMHAIWTGEQRLRPFFMLTNMAVPTFFVISALLYYRRWEPTWACYAGKLKSRVRSLLVPYVLYNTLFYGYYIIKIHVLHRPTEKVIPTEPLEALWCIVRGVPDGVLWYVRDLFLFALVAPLIGIAIQRSGRWAPVLILASLGCWSLPYESLFFWTPCLAAGCYAALHLNEVTAPFRRLYHAARTTRIVAGIILTAAVVTLCLTLARTTTDSMEFYLYRMVSPLLVALAFCLIGALAPARIVTLVAPLTFVIYCTHTAFVDVAKAVFPAPPADAGLAVVTLRYALVVLTALVPAVTAALAVRRWLPWLWRPLTGFRTEHPNIQ